MGYYDNGVYLRVMYLALPQLASFGGDIVGGTKIKIRLFLKRTRGPYLDPHCFVLGVLNWIRNGVEVSLDRGDVV